MFMSTYASNSQCRSRPARLKASLDDLRIADPLQQERAATTLRLDHKGADVEVPRDWPLREGNLCNVIERNRLNVPARVTVPDHNSVRDDKILSPLA